MSWPRFRLEECPLLEEGLWRLAPEEARHLVTVRHCREGDSVEGLMPGRLLLFRLERCDGGWAVRLIEEMAMTDDIPEIVLLAGLLKGDAFDLLLRQVTELGVSRIVPLLCDHSVVRLEGGRADKKQARWLRIVQEESKQCRSPMVPLIEVPRPVEGALALDLPRHRFLAAIEKEATPLGALDVPSSVVLAVGPEGDWSLRERSLFEEACFSPVYLGDRILRAFTAAAVVTSWAVLGWKGGRRVDS